MNKLHVQNPTKLASLYHENGIIHLSNFLSLEILHLVEHDLVLAEAIAQQDLEDKWQGKRLTFYSKNPVKSADAVNKEDFVVDPYFQASSDSCHIFFEAIDNVVVLNRMGHGLHLHPALENIQKIVFENALLHSILKEVGYKKPICLLSVYIPKLPHGHGSEVRPHQESTFANTNPLSSCVLWIALEDATIENACMYGLPKSHQLPLKYVSVVDHERKIREYRQLNDVDIPTFDPNGSEYSPLEVAVGNALLFHGNYVHCSPQNLSNKSRKALSFQFIETEETQFSDFNWIKTPNNRVLYG